MYYAVSLVTVTIISMCLIQSKQEKIISFLYLLLGQALFCAEAFVAYFKKVANYLSYFGNSFLVHIGHSCRLILSYTDFDVCDQCGPVISDRRIIP